MARRSDESTAHADDADPGRFCDPDPMTRGGRERTVLASTDAAAFGSLRHAATSRAERYEIGRSLRERVPRSALATWDPDARRADPVQQVIASNHGRVDRLVPVRIGRMAASPFAFLRGAAGVMAEDFSGLPATGITPVICGDAHLGNFGFYASPERDLVFDLNDFDEAHPGAWEWDLRRLVTSVWVAGRENNASEEAWGDAVAVCIEEYRQQIAGLAEKPLLARSYEHLDLDRMLRRAPGTSLRTEIETSAHRARKRTGDRALPRITEERDGARRIVSEPPLITRPEPAEAEQLAEALDAYLTTLPPHWARVVSGYRLVDIAHKVVGVGSVGLRAWVGLCEGSSADDVLFLQLKQARRSVVAPFVHGDSAWHAHQGQRVVEYQQAVQTVS